MHIYIYTQGLESSFCCRVARQGLAEKERFFHRHRFNYNILYYVIIVLLLIIVIVLILSQRPVCEARVRAAGLSNTKRV